MRSKFILAACLLASASAAPAQVRGGRQPAAPVLQGIDALRADFRTRTGSDTVYFGANSAILAPQTKALLAAQAGWLRRQPEVVVQIEGHGDSNDSRDHALALGARRAAEVRDYLVLLGVPAAQIGVTSWGKARPGTGRAVTVLVR